MSHTSYRKRSSTISSPNNEKDERLISHFAKKYSQVGLPNKTQLFDRQNSHKSLFSIQDDSQGSDNSPDLPSDEENNLTTDNDDLNTVISHNSYKSEHPNNLSSLQHKEISAYEELSKIQKTKEFYEQMFDKHLLAEEGEEDCDFEEFKKGLKKLGVKMNEEQIKHLFSVLDDSEDGYVDRSQWSDFLTRRYNSSELQMFQQAIIQAMGTQENMKNEDDWEDEQISLVEEEMRKQMQNMVDVQLKKK